MNKYNYEIYESSKTKILIIKEKIGSTELFNWEVKEFIPGFFNSFSKTKIISSEIKIVSSRSETIDSYNRTKKWLIENHPELMI